VRTIKIRQIFNLAIPANEFVNFGELMTQGNIEDYRDICATGRGEMHSTNSIGCRRNQAHC
jgi:hypothetical protein